MGNEQPDTCGGKLVTPDSQAFQRAFARRKAIGPSAYGRPSRELAHTAKTPDRAGEEHLVGRGELAERQGLLEDLQAKSRWPP